MADMVDEAVGPEENEDTAWGRALVTPDTGSDFELGQGFLEGFFFEEDHVPESGLELCPAWELGGLGDTVDVDEVDPKEEEELDL
jgi:hypothetical protein